MRKNKKSMLLGIVAAVVLEFGMPVTGIYCSPDIQMENAGIHFEKDGAVADSFLTKADDRLNLMPKEIQSVLKKKGWKLYITDKNLASYFYGGAYKSVAGSTDLVEKTIHIEDRDSAIKRAIVHECGHAVDSELGYPSTSGDFNSIFDEEKYSFTDSTAVGDAHETSNTMEYFASAWSEYYINRENLKSRAPKTYAYIEQAACKITGISSALGSADNTSSIVGPSYSTSSTTGPAYDNFNAAFSEVAANDFHADIYYKNYPDLQVAIGNNPDALLRHYKEYGIKEGRNAATLINQ